MSANHRQELSPEERPDNLVVKNLKDKLVSAKKYKGGGPLLPPLAQNANVSINNSTIAPLKSNPSDYVKPAEGLSAMKKTKSTVRKKKVKKSRRASEIRNNPTPDAGAFYRVRVESGKGPEQPGGTR